MGHEAAASIEFSDRPPVLVLADSEAGVARARRIVELAGCRVSASVPLEGASERLDRQVSLAVPVVHVERDHGPELDTLLSRLQALAEQEGRASVVLTPDALIDVVSARAPSLLVQHLVAASEMEMVAAVAVASARPRHRLNDIGRDEGAPRLQQISQEVARISAMLATLAEREARGERLGPTIAPGGERPSPVDAGAVRAIIRARRLRDQYFGTDLFADPAWDILLDLYAAQLEKQRVAVSSLCIAAAVPATTALRWIKTLTDLGLLVRSADPQDGRRVYIELSPATEAGLAAYLTAAQRISPLIL
jgi:DNA-binding MarR family transcriptional regulator